MPTYEYRCEKCGNEFDFFQSMKDDRLTDCPEETCDGKVRRLIGTGAGIIFKGSGFYETDYRSDSYKKAAKADSGSDSGGSGGGDGGGDSSGSEKSSGSGSDAAAKPGDSGKKSASTGKTDSTKATSKPSTSD